MQASKILFSAEELRVIENSDWILTKNSAINKIISLFGLLSQSYHNAIASKGASLPDEVFSSSPKISRGEKYLGLPYVVLDHPRIFSKENVFAIRTFFWWGNYFSLTLHLKGKFKAEFQNSIENHFGILAENNFSIAVSDDEWRHDFGKENYLSLRTGGMNELRNNMGQKNFLKLAVNWPLKRSNEIASFLEEQYLILLTVVTG